MKTIHSTYFWLLLLLLTITLGMPGCNNNDPAKEDVPETITEVTLEFTTDQGNTKVTVTATDPDGDGGQPIVVGYPADLVVSKTYTMKIKLVNGLADSNSPSYNVTDEITTEGIDHMFYFAFTDGLFASPAGDGNVDSRADVVNYGGGSDSNDVNGLPLGLTTTWTTTDATSTGTLRILLKHQPGLKSSTSGSDIGETDLDVTFDIVVH